MRYKILNESGFTVEPKDIVRNPSRHTLNGFFIYTTQLRDKYDRNKEYLLEHLEGKWIIEFENQSDALDTSWNKVLELLENGLLYSVKVAGQNEEYGGQSIIIYTQDAKDDKDVFRILETLLSHGIDKGCKSIGYKSNKNTLDHKDDRMYVNETSNFIADFYSKEIAKDAGKEIDKDADKEIAKNAGKEIDKDADKEIAKDVGIVAGSILGSTGVGASLGAVIGTFALPGIGTAAGAVVGTLFGFGAGLLTVGIQGLIRNRMFGKPSDNRGEERTAAAAFVTLGIIGIGTLLGTILLPGLGTLFGYAIGAVTGIVVSVLVDRLSRLIDRNLSNTVKIFTKDEHDTHEKGKKTEPLIQESYNSTLKGLESTKHPRPSKETDLEVQLNPTNTSYPAMKQNGFGKAPIGMQEERLVSQVFASQGLDPLTHTIALAMDGGMRWGIPYNEYKDQPFCDAVKEIAENEAKKSGKEIKFNNSPNSTFVHHFEFLPINYCKNLMPESNYDSTSGLNKIL